MSNGYSTDSPTMIGGTTDSPSLVGTGPYTEEGGTRGSAHYQELRQMWVWARRALRGEMEGRQFSRAQVDARIRQWSGRGPIRNLAQLTRALMQEANAGGAPLEPTTAARRQLAQITSGATLGIPRVNPAFREYVAPLEEQAGREGRGLEALGALLPFGALGGLGRGAATVGAGLMAGTETATHLPPGTTVSEAIPPVAFGTGAGLLTGAAGAFGPAAVSRLTNPGARLGEKMISRLGGPGAVTQMGRDITAVTPEAPPALAELGGPAGTMGQYVSRTAPRINPEIRAGLIRRAEELLDQASQAKRTVGARYAVLDGTLPQAREVLKRPLIKATLRDLDIKPGRRLTARQVNDIRMSLNEEARALQRKVAAGTSSTAERTALGPLRAASVELNQLLNTHVEGFREIQQVYGPYAQLEAQRRALLSQLTRMGRSMPIAQPAKMSLRGEIADELNIDAQDLRYRAAQALAPSLLKPHTEGLADLLRMRPPNLAGPAAGLLSPLIALPDTTRRPVLNPFFPQQR